MQVKPANEQWQSLLPFLKFFPEIGARHDVRQFLEAVLWIVVRVHNGITAEGLRKLWFDL